MLRLGHYFAFLQEALHSGREAGLRVFGLSKKAGVPAKDAAADRQRATGVW
jgi:hypothetical protein